MALILLVRHAVTDSTGKRLSGSLPGILLSEKGRAQADGLAKRLAGIRLAGIYASPLERCMETAEAIARARNLSVQPVAALQEVGYGRWTGRPLAQLARTELWKRLHGAPSGIRFPDGETLAEVQQRSVAALREIAGHHARATIAAVTHADVIRLALAHFAGVHLDLYQRFIVSPASVSAVALGEGAPRVLRVNDTGTLTDLVVGRPRHRPTPRRGS